MATGDAQTQKLPGRWQVQTPMGHRQMGTWTIPTVPQRQAQTRAEQRVAKGSEDCLGPTRTLLIKVRVMAAKDKLGMGKKPLGKQPTVCPGVVLERGVEYGGR